MAKEIGRNDPCFVEVEKSTKYVIVMFTQSQEQLV